tara:strand:- start:214 stop:675 length:462 start_codon:yes stop_codon:yes gene_type:complete
LKSAIRLVPARWRHINHVANRMRAIDRRECEAFGKSPKAALRDGLMRSDIAWTALVNERPEAMFGVVVESVLGGDGRPWFLGTDEVYRHGRALLMWGPGLISRLHNSNLTLSNLVSSENGRAIRLLRKWGFEVEDQQQEFGAVKFQTFRKEPA